MGIALSGNYAYVADYDSGLQIIDITDPANPIFAGSYDTPGPARKVTLSGNYAYVTGLQIIDITDPANPTFVGSYDTSEWAMGVTLSGNYAYTVNRDAGLQIIDITNPANPTFVGSYDTPSLAQGIALSKNYAYVADRLSGLQIIDVTDPANPTFAGSYDTPDWAQGITLSGNYAYVADRFSVQIIDITDPANPTFKVSYDTPGFAVGVTLSENYAYVADAGLQIMAPNLDKLTLSGIPSSVGTYRVDIKGCNEINECVTDSFDIIVSNIAPIIARPLQDQTARVNTSFSYIFPSDSFIDQDGHSLTYTAKLSDDTSLPSWLNFDSSQRKFSGMPTTPSTYPINVTANDSYGGIVSDSFDIIVTNPTNLSPVVEFMIIGGGIIGAIGITCGIIDAIGITCVMVIGGILALKHHSKSLKDNSITTIKEEKELETIPEKKEDEQEPESTISKNDTQIVVDNEESKRVEQQKKDEILKEDLKTNEQEAPMVSEKEDS
jgi:hypothetical protein